MHLLKHIRDILIQLFIIYIYTAVPSTPFLYRRTSSTASEEGIDLKSLSEYKIQEFVQYGTGGLRERLLVENMLKKCTKREGEQCTVYKPMKLRKPFEDITNFM